MNLPKSWIQTSLGEVSSKPQYGYTTKAANVGSVKFLRTTDITSGRITWPTVPFCKDAPADDGKYDLEDGDVVISRAGSVGFSFLVKNPPKAVFASYLIRFKPSIDENYFHLFLKSPFYWREISESKIGIAVGNVNANKLKQIPFPLPPLNEQKRIVEKIEELFSEIDAGVASLQRAREQLGVYRQALLKKAFTGELTAQWRAENPDQIEPAEQLLERIRQEREAHFAEEMESWQRAYDEWKDGGEKGKKPPKPKKHKELESEYNASLPLSVSGWHILNLSQLVMALRQGWSPKCENHPAADGEWSVMTTTAIQPLSFLPGENKKLPDGLYPRSWITVKKDDILITRAGPRSRCGILCRVSEDSPKLMLCDKAYRLRFSESEISAEFIELLLNSFEFSQKIEQLKTGINDSGVNITQNGFLQLQVPVPPLAEQKEIVRLLDAQFEAIEQNEQEIDAALTRAEALRQSILKKAFSGQLVPQDPNDEPASVLLERIQAEREAAAAKKPKKKAAKKRTKKL